MTISSSLSKDEKSSSPMSIQALNWAGSIPIVLTLAPSSLSSPTLPPPIHVLVSRQTFLHAGLEDAVRRLHQFAPTTVSFRAGLVRIEPDPGASNHTNNENHDTADGCDGEEGKKNKETTTTTQSTDTDVRNPVQRSSSSSSDTPPYPICWFEDEESQTALRWNLFTGVLYDLMNVQKRRPKEGGGGGNEDPLSSSPTASASSSSSSSSLIPWKIRLHFTAAYPTSQILPFDTNNTSSSSSSSSPATDCSPLLLQVWNFYKNSLKQALCLQNGNSKAAMNLSKENHGRLWDAVRLGDNFGLYHQVHREQPYLSLLSSSSSSASAAQCPKRLPTRILVDAKPPRQASSLYTDALTLGRLLAQELPNHFIVVKKNQPQDSSSPSSSSGAAATTTTTNKNDIIVIAKDDCVLDWSVAGIVKPSLDIPVATLWENLCHADHFLYIIVHTF